MMHQAISVSLKFTGFFHRNKQNLIDMNNVLIPKKQEVLTLVKSNM